MMRDKLAAANAQVEVFEQTMLRLEAKVYGSPSPSIMPAEVYRAKNPATQGFMFLIEFADSRGKIARVLGTQSGLFWPVRPNLTQGIGNNARNIWAAKHAAHIYAIVSGESATTDDKL